jgi:hypothetical protein
MICLLVKCYPGDENKKDERGGECSTYGGCIQGFGGKPERRNYLEGLVIDGRIILNRSSRSRVVRLRIRTGGMAEGTDRWYG